MPSNTDSFLQIFQAIWGFWPLMFLASLEGTLNRSRKRHLGSNIVHNLLLIWGLFAIVSIVSTVGGYPVAGYVIPQPLNSMLFWTFGLVLIVLKMKEATSERTYIQQQTQTIREVSELTSLSPLEFEKVVAETYLAHGYEVQIVGAQGDHGIDLILHSPKGEKYAVQCKRWKGKVGEPVLRDFYGAMQHENAVIGTIVTTGGFTPQAREWAKDKPIRLVDGEAFLKAMRRTQRASGADPTSESAKAPISESQAPSCPLCGSRTVLRTARQGAHQGEQFYGCSNYPKCRGIVRMEPGRLERDRHLPVFCQDTKRKQADIKEAK